MKNYSTSIDYHKTVAEISALLGRFGASSILVEYEERKPVRLFFRVTVNNREIPFRMPCNWKGILIVLQRESKLPSKQRTEDQALRVGWRCIKDWVEAQLSFVESEMVQLHQVFLAYSVTENGTSLSDEFDKKLLN